MGLHRDNGKENGLYYLECKGSGFRVSDLGLRV